MYQEKKFFSPKICTYSDNLSKRWRIEYYAPVKGSREIKRVTVYGDINTGKTIEERYKLADKEIKKLGFDTPINHVPIDTNAKTVLHKALLKKQPGWEPATYTAYLHIVNDFCTYLQDHTIKTPNSATSDNIDDWILLLRKSGAGKAKISKYRDFLSYTYNHAIKHKLCKYNPVEIVDKVKTDSESLNYFSEDQIQMFKVHREKGYISDQMWLSILLLFYCAIRPKEQCLLTIRNIDFGNAYITVTSTVSKNNKTQKVRIPDQLAREIDYLKYYPKKYLVFSKSGTPGYDAITRKTLYDEHCRVLKEIEIYGNWSHYSWKHTGAVRMVKQGIHIKDIQLHLRHSSLDMTDRYLRKLGALDSEDLKTKYPTL